MNSIHFRRQYAIGKYVVDFCAPRQKLIIEVDGSQHLDREAQDNDRAAYLTLQGYRILRFWNNDVMNNLEGVIIAIEQALLENQAYVCPPPASPKSQNSGFRGGFLL